MLDKNIEDFVLLKAGDTRHSGRSFFEHLTGVHELLERQGASVHVCLAGLCHSIYGTNIFKHQAARLIERDQVARVIGEKAERLAFIFCSCERPQALVEAIKRGLPYQVIDRRDGSVIALSPADMRDLLDIELANQVEQGGKMMLPIYAARKAFLAELIDV